MQWPEVRIFLILLLAMPKFRSSVGEGIVTIDEPTIDHLESIPALHVQVERNENRHCKVQEYKVNNTSYEVPRIR